MPLLVIREEWPPQGDLGYLIEEVETGRFFDFESGTLADHPRRMIGQLRERWKDHDHDQNGAPDPTADEVRPLRGCYANVDPARPERPALDVSALPAGLYKIYIADLEANGAVVRIYDWVHGPDPSAPDVNQPGTGAALNLQLPENLSFKGSLTVDVPGLGTVDLTQAAPRPAPAPTPDNPQKAPQKAPQPTTPARKPAGPAGTAGRKGGRKSS